MKRTNAADPQASTERPACVFRRYSMTRLGGFDLLLELMQTTRQKVRALLAEPTEERTRRLDISIDRVLQQLAQIGFCDPRKLSNHNGSLKNIAELDADTAAAIEGIEIVSD